MGAAPSGVAGRESRSRTYRGSPRSFPRSPGTAAPFPARQLGRHRPAFVAEKARDSPERGRGAAAPVRPRPAERSPGAAPAPPGTEMMLLPRALARIRPREGGTRSGQVQRGSPPGSLPPTAVPAALARRFASGSVAGLLQVGASSAHTCTEHPAGLAAVLAPLAEPAGALAGREAALLKPRAAYCLPRSDFCSSWRSGNVAIISHKPATPTPHFCGSCWSSPNSASFTDTGVKN